MGMLHGTLKHSQRITIHSLHADYTYPDSVMYPYPHRAPIMHSHVFYNVGSLVLQKNSWFHDACTTTT
jgi:hypothetical protein